MPNICSKHAETLGKYIKGSSETFDLTGKSNPQYRRYSDWGKFLKNKFGGKEVVDPQGNSWMEIDLKKEMGRLPIEAFGAIPFLMPQEDENK